MSVDPGAYFFNFLLLSIVALPLYYTMPWPLFRRLLLTTISVYLIYLIAPRLVMYWVGYWVVVWGFHAALLHTKDSRSRAMLFALGILTLLLPMVLWKLYPYRFETQVNLILHKMLSTAIPLLGSIDYNRPVLVPIGLSFSTFRALDLLICTQLNLHGRLTLVDILTYGLFTPTLIVGPIAQFSEVQNAGLRNPTVDLWGDLSAGIFRIVLGYFKLYVIAYNLRHSESLLLHFDTASQGGLLLSVFLYSWYLYINFSGFSDLGIGTARLYGVRLHENFNFPYFRPNLQQFWANWHMSLTRFAQRNVFIPLGGFRANRQYVAAFLTMMVIALWHELSLSLVIFGTMHGAVLVGLRYRQTRTAQSEKSSAGVRAVGTLVTYAFVALTIPLLILPNTDVYDFYLYLFFGIR